MTLTDMPLTPNLIYPNTHTIEQIVDDYVQRARSSMRPTEYQKERSGDTTLHHVVENDQFRILEHVIAVRGKQVAWIWRNQDFWPTDQLTDITIAGDDLATVGIIHGGSMVHGVKFTYGPRFGASSDPDNCLPFVSDFNHLEAHYRLDGTAMRLNRARMGVDFTTKIGRTLLARSVRSESASLANRGFTYRSSLGNRLLVRVDGIDNLSINVPTELTESEVSTINECVLTQRARDIGELLHQLFIVHHD